MKQLNERGADYLKSKNLIVGQDQSAKNKNTTS